MEQSLRIWLQSVKKQAILNREFSMNTVELLNKMEEVCKFSILDTATLLDKIERILHLKKSESVLARREREIRVESNPFAIEDKNIILDLSKEEDFRRYKNKIMELEELKIFLKKNEEKGVFKLVSKMITYIEEKTKPKLRFDKEEDNLTGRVVDIICEDILKNHIKKIIVSLYREVFHEGISKNKSNLELLSYLNQYLENLGVYTMIAKKGDLYEGEIMDNYEGIAIPERKRRKEAKLIFIDNPAYFIRYRDEYGEECKSGIQGSCVIE